MTNALLLTAELLLSAAYCCHVCSELETLPEHRQKKPISRGRQRWKEKLWGPKVECAAGGKHLAVWMAPPRELLEDREVSPSPEQLRPLVAKKGVGTAEVTPVLASIDGRGGTAAFILCRRDTART